MENLVDNMVYIPYNVIKMVRSIVNKFILEFYEKENGGIPVGEFLLGLDKKMRAKILSIMDVLQEGDFLREPYSKYLEDGIFEIRGKVGSDITRVLYFFYYEGKIVFTNGYVKKTQKTPVSEILKAKYSENI